MTEKQIKGIATYVLRNKDSGKEISRHTQANTLTLNAFNSFSSVTNIGISGNILPADSYRQTMHNVFAIGTNIPGIPSPSSTVKDGSNYYFEYTQRFSAPVTTRTIQTITLTSSGSVSLGQTNTFAHLVLTTPCTQTPTEILDVFYRIQFPQDITKPERYMTNTISQFRTNAFFRYITGDWKANIDPLSIPFIVNDEGIRLVKPLGRQQNINNFKNATTFNSVVNGGLYGAREQLKITDIGRIYGTVGMSGSTLTSVTSLSDIGDATFFWKNISADGDTPVQNIFNHATSATTPFFDSLTGASGLGNINVDGSSWTDPDFPKLYRIDITTTGDNNSAEYKFKVRNNLGFFNSTYKDLAVDLPGYAPVFNLGMPTINQTIHKYDENIALHVGPNIIIKVDIRDYSNPQVFNATNGLTATSIGQLAVTSTGEILVSCRQTGLYKISTDGLTITAFDATTFGGPVTLTNKCFGVDVGFGDKIWAMFDGGLAESSDSGTSWTVYNQTTVTTFTNAIINAQYNSVMHIKVNPNNANDELMILYHTNVTGNGLIPIAFWSRVVGGSTTNTSGVNNFYNVIALPVVNDSNITTASYNSRLYSKRSIVFENGKWAFNTVQTNTILTFYDFNNPIIASTSASNIFATSLNLANDNLGNQVIIAINSSQQIALVSDDGTHALCSGNMNYNTGLFQDRTIGYNFSSSSNNLRSLVYMGNGLAVWDRNGQQLGSMFLSLLGDSNSSLGGILESELWKDYGWDGSSWVEGNTNSKPVHTGLEPLHDGLTISFDDNGDQFVSPDYFTFAVVNGIQVDGATEYDVNFKFFRAPIDDNVGFEFGILPSTNTTVISNIHSTSGTPVFTGTWEFKNSAPSTTTASGITSGGSSSPGTDSDLTNSITNTFIQRFRNTRIVSNDFTLRFQAYRLSVGTVNVIIGLAPTSLIGDPNLDSAQNTHSMYFKKNNSFYEIEIIESGASVFTFTDLIGSTSSAFDDRISIRRTGNIVTYLYNDQVIYTSATLLTADSIVQIITEGNHAVNVTNLSPISITAVANTKIEVTDRFIKIGNPGGPTGVFDPDFYRINDEINTRNPIFIDGVEATVTLNGNFNTVLTAGNVHLNSWDGVVRYSPDDDGKTITGNFTSIKKL